MEGVAGGKGPSDTVPRVGFKVSTLPVSFRGTVRKSSMPWVASACPVRTVGKNWARAAQSQGWDRRRRGRVVCRVGKSKKTGMGRNHECSHGGVGAREGTFQVHLPGSPNRCISQAGARCIWDPRPLARRGKDRVLGLSREDGTRGAEEALRGPDSSCSIWEPISFRPPGPRKTEKGCGLGRAVGSIETESSIEVGAPG